MTFQRPCCPSCVPWHVPARARSQEEGRHGGGLSRRLAVLHVRPCLQAPARRTTAVAVWFTSATARPSSGCGAERQSISESRSWHVGRHTCCRHVQASTRAGTCACVVRTVQCLEGSSGPLWIAVVVAVTVVTVAKGCWESRGRGWCEHVRASRCPHACRGSPVSCRAGDAMQPLVLVEPPRQHSAPNENS
jgi:hypothetical protein